MVIKVKDLVSFKISQAELDARITKERILDIINSQISDFLETKYDMMYYSLFSLRITHTYPDQNTQDQWIEIEYELIETTEISADLNAVDERLVIGL